MWPWLGLVACLAGGAWARSEGRLVPSVPYRVTAPEGATVDLHCRVEGLGAAKVAWVRSLDRAVLSVGAQRYDRRARIVHDSLHGDWLLRLRQASARDTGLYECQLASPDVPVPQTSLVILSVVPPADMAREASVALTLSPQLGLGRPFRLTCSLNLRSPSAVVPNGVRWLHDDKSVHLTERFVSERYDTPWSVTFVLGVWAAEAGDRGEWACQPDGNHAMALRLALDGSSTPTRQPLFRPPPRPSTSQLSRSQTSQEAESSMDLEASGDTDYEQQEEVMEAESAQGHSNSSSALHFQEIHSAGSLVPQSRALLVSLLCFVLSVMLA